MKQLEAEQQNEGQRLERVSAALELTEKVASVAEPMAQDINRQYSQHGKSAAKRVGLAILMVVIAIISYLLLTR